MKNNDQLITRRTWIASILAIIGLFVSYGIFALEGLFFLVPKNLEPKKRNFLLVL